MKIGVYTNRIMDAECKIAQGFVAAALSVGYDCGGQFECGFDKPVKKFDNLEELAAWAEMIAVIGGDGTVLAVAGETAKKGVPILAIHNGSLGFLTEVKITEIKKALKLINEGKYDTEQRTMLETKFDGETHVALNEVLIARRNRSGICKLSAYCDGVYFDTYTGDGVIVSTPTGSTGYSLSAGGPVLSPKLEAIVLTPLCVHALNNRSIVFNDSEVLMIRVDGKDDHNCIHIDGRQLSKDVKVGMSFEIKKSKLTTRFVRFSEKSFYARMYSKLANWNKRD